MQVEAYGRTECGPVRDNNEDALLIDVAEGIFIVADGMGGHAAGEVASAMAVEGVHEILVGEQDPDETRLVRTIDVQNTADVVRERLRYAMNQASQRIRRVSEERPGTRGMGTTVVTLVIDGDQAHLAHVGDSRAYLLREGSATRLTRDHTVVQQEIDAGRLAPELARLLPHRNILTQSVGFHGPVEPDTSTRVIEPGDIFLLCSDGLTDVLEDHQLAEIADGHEVDDLPEVFVEAALGAGAEDNVTVVVVSVN